MLLILIAGKVASSLNSECDIMQRLVLMHLKTAVAKENLLAEGAAFEMDTVYDNVVFYVL